MTLFSITPKATYQSPPSSSYFVSSVLIWSTLTHYFLTIPEIATGIASFSVASLLFINPIPGFIVSLVSCGIIVISCVKKDLTFVINSDLGRLFCRIDQK